MASAVLRGYEPGELEQTHAVRMLGGVFHGCVSLEAAGGFGRTAVDPRRSWEWIIDSPDVLPGVGEVRAAG
ncbi:TetR-like C-terminal domain-containing protein [Kitasatospora sp. NPDC096204]|uniref:TetR-like C-terminal domain-containing protein n=1 Tax=Kitasatospora sp. NPDC096204 TaxID=3364094 RepID=UPI0038188BD0